jgi:hypothetical protein
MDCFMHKGTLKNNLSHLDKVMFYFTSFGKMAWQSVGLDLLNYGEEGTGTGVAVRSADLNPVENMWSAVKLKSIGF